MDFSGLLLQRSVTFSTTRSSKDPEGDKQMNKWLNSSEVLSALPVSTVFNISMAASRILSRVNFHLVSASITKKMYMEAL